MTKTGPPEGAADEEYSAEVCPVRVPTARQDYGIVDERPQRVGPGVAGINDESSCVIARFVASDATTRTRTVRARTTSGAFRP